MQVKMFGRALVLTVLAACLILGPSNLRASAPQPTDLPQPDRPPATDNPDDQSRDEHNQDRHIRDRRNGLFDLVVPLILEQAEHPRHSNQGENVDDSTRGRGQAAAPARAAAAPPTPVAGDPEGGIAVTGGTVHRGTGSIEVHEGDTRTAIYCWVDVAANAACKDFKWYQWQCVVVTGVDFGDGRGMRPLAPKDAVTGKAYSIPGTLGTATDDPPSEQNTSNGRQFMFGTWDADDYVHAKDGRPADTSRQKMFTGAAIPGCTEPANPPEAGVYFAFPSIPGLPDPAAKDEKARLPRLVDAPDLARSPVVVNAIYYKLKHLTKAKSSGLRTSPPPAEKPITVQVTYYFRDMLYCAKDCLGKFEYSVQETIEINSSWDTPKSAADIDQASGKQYYLSGVGKRTSYGPPVFGAFQPCVPALAHPAPAPAPAGGDTHTRER